jgi:hypothetical protein
MSMAQAIRVPRNTRKTRAGTRSVISFRGKQFIGMPYRIVGTIE